jgi:hypothetical protein
MDTHENEEDLLGARPTPEAVELTSRKSIIW